MTEWRFQWANGGETSRGRTVEEACRHLKTEPDKIVTGYIVRVRRNYGIKKETNWEYWDAEQFWKNLKEAPDNKELTMAK